MGGLSWLRIQKPKRTLNEHTNKESNRKANASRE